MALTNAVILGRDEEIRALDSLINAVAGGNGSAAQLSGEPGIGKSTLLQRAADECRQRGFLVLHGSPEAMESDTPFAALAGYFGLDRIRPAPELADLAELLSAGERHGRIPGAARWEYVVTESAVELIEKQAARQPVALLLDDMHWADSASLVVVHRIARLLRQLPVLLVCAHRPVPAGPELGRLLHGLARDGALTMRLEPLSPGTAAELTERILAEPATEAVLELVAGAAGNPFYIEELVSSLNETGGWATGAAPPSFTEAVHRKLDFLSSRSRDVLRMMAVLGGRVPIQELSAASGHSPLELWNLVRDAVDNGLLVEDGDRIAFRHDLIRQAMMAALSETLRQPMLLEAGRALAETGAPAHRVAQYLLAGGTLDSASIDWLIESAITLIRRSSETAIGLLTMARAQLGATSARADMLRFLHVIALQWAGHGADAEAAARSALAQNRTPALTAQLRWSIARGCILQGNVRGATEATEATISAGALDPVELGRMHAALAQYSYLLGNAEDSTRNAEAALRLGEQTGDSYTVAAGQHLLGSRKLETGDPAGALTLVTAARSSWGDQEFGPDSDDLGIQLLQANCLLELDQLDAAEQCLREGLPASEACGSPALPWYSAVSARIAYEQGRWEDGLAEIQAGHEPADPFGQQAALRMQEALIRIHRDETLAPLRFPEVAGPAYLYEYLYRWALALDAERAGSPETALALHLAHTRQARDERGQAALVHHTWVDLARVAITVDDRGVLDELVPPARDWQRRCPTPVKSGLVAVLRGGAAGDPELLAAGARDFQDGGRPLLAGQAWEITAYVAAAADVKADALAALEKAVSAFQELDARWDLRRVEQWARSSGLRRKRRSANRPTTGWDSLTPTEVRVALLVAEGLSNPDIASRLKVSRRTIQSHVSSVLAKLDCRSRVELAVIASKHRPQQAEG
ncbi:BREX system ATP-binding domain-containing protein [Saccharopolyspora shandongensis]|uniref:helix-turn-helix transcriptional regulator n=1 Tax=Saccharopolyspora shandongensis TaxID=418495 RepID=UPI00343A0399